MLTTKPIAVVFELGKEHVANFSTQLVVGDIVRLDKAVEKREIDLTPTDPRRRQLRRRECRALRFPRLVCTASRNDGLLALSRHALALGDDSAWHGAENFASDPLDLDGGTRGCCY